MGGKRQNFLRARESIYSARKRVYSRRFFVFVVFGTWVEGNFAGTYLFFWGFRRRVGEDVFGFNFILGLQKAPKFGEGEG